MHGSLNIQGVRWENISGSKADQLQADHRKLVKIDEIGWKHGALLLKEFDSFEGVKEASNEELTNVDGIGRIRAKKIQEQLSQFD